MSTPAVLQLLDEAGARLAKLTIANGYTHDVGRVERARVSPYQPYDLPCASYWPAFDAFKDRKYRVVQRTLDIRVELYAIANDQPFTDIAMKLSYAAWTVLNRSTSAPLVTNDWSPNLGGLLTAFDLQQITPLIGEGSPPWCGCLLNLAATYKVDPYDHTIIVMS